MATADAQIIGIEHEVSGLVLGDKLEAIVVRHPHAEERFIDAASGNTASEFPNNGSAVKMSTTL